MNEPKPHLKLTTEQHAVARMLKERHGLSWPHAAIIARDVIALQVVDGSLSLPLDPGDPPLRRRKKAPVRYAEHERQEALEEFRNSPPITFSD